MFIITDNNDILISQGETAPITVPLYDQDYKEYIMTPNQRIEMTITRDINTSDGYVKKWTSNAGSNELVIQHNDTKDLTPGIYKYDVVLIETTNGVDTVYNYIIPPRTFEILPVVSVGG